MHIQTASAIRWMRQLSSDNDEKMRYVARIHADFVVVFILVRVRACMWMFIHRRTNRKGTIEVDRSKPSRSLNEQWRKNFIEINWAILSSRPVLSLRSVCVRLALIWLPSVCHKHFSAFRQKCKSFLINTIQNWLKTLCIN